MSESGEQPESNSKTYQSRQQRLCQWLSRSETVFTLFGGVIAFIVVVLVLGAILYLLVAWSCLVLDDVKGYSEIIKNVVQAGAFVVAGLWTYRLFVKNRLNYPLVRIDHAVEHWPLDDDKSYLSVLATVENTSSVLLELEYAKVMVQQMLPVPDALQTLINKAPRKALSEGTVAGLFQPEEHNTQIDWWEVGHRILKWEKGDTIVEPGESERFQCEFILDRGIQRIKVITYFENPKAKKGRTGWRNTTIYDLEGMSHSISGRGCLAGVLELLRRGSS